MKESNLHILNHPIIQYKLGRLRERTTKTAEFRHIFHQLAHLVAFEAFRHLEINTKEITTSTGLNTSGDVIESPIIISIMRAGNEMLDGVLSLLPDSSAGHIGIYRDRSTQNTVEYYLRLPKVVKGKAIFLLDPNLATGNTMLASIDRLNQFGVGKITVLCFLVSQEGVNKVHFYYPEIKIFAAAIEPSINEQGFLIPGLGDVSNRLYGITNKI